MDDAELKICRRAYAAQMLARASVDRNEALLVLSPLCRARTFWGRRRGRCATGSATWRCVQTIRSVLYQDLLFALQADRQVYNVARACMRALTTPVEVAQERDRLPCNNGNCPYTAIIAEIVHRKDRPRRGRRVRRNWRKGQAQSRAIRKRRGRQWKRPRMAREAAVVVYVNFTLHHRPNPGSTSLRPADGAAVSAPAHPRLAARSAARRHLAGRLLRHRQEGEEIERAFCSRSISSGARGSAGDLSLYRARSCLPRRRSSTAFTRCAGMRSRPSRDSHSQEQGLVMANLH